MAQLVSGVEAPAFTALGGAQEDKGLAVPVEREGVQFVVLRGEGVDPDAVCFEEVQDVGDRPLAESPAGTDDLSRRFGIVTGQARDIHGRQFKPSVDPVIDQQGDPAGAERPVTLPGGHLARRPEAHRLFGNLVNIGGAEECR